jgi:hypothetical protein
LSIAEIAVSVSTVDIVNDSSSAESMQWLWVHGWGLWLLLLIDYFF